MRHALVFGASGQIGQPLLARLSSAGWRVTAVSRSGHPDARGLQWLEGSLDRVDGLPARVDAVLSCGPLDHFARWYAMSTIDCPRVVAFGSTSVEIKRDSKDAAERDVAARLRAGEQGLFAVARTRQAQATLLRPTLVYGGGSDRTLSRIAAIARRWGRFVLPSDATGLRQPVHVEDLANVAFAALDAPASSGRAYALPGGETISYARMVARVLDALQPPARLHVVPAPLFRGVLGCAQVVGVARGFNPQQLARMREDLVFDDDAARTDLDYAPRRFMPTAKMFAGPTSR